MIPEPGFVIQVIGVGQRNDRALDRRCLIGQVIGRGSAEVADIPEDFGVVIVVFIQRDDHVIRPGVSGPDVLIGAFPVQHVVLRVPDRAGFQAVRPCGAFVPAHRRQQHLLPDHMVGHRHHVIPGASGMPGAHGILHHVRHFQIRIFIGILVAFQHAPALVQAEVVCMPAGSRRASRCTVKCRVHRI